MTILVLSSHTPSLFWFRMDMMQAFCTKGAKVVAVGPESENNWSKKFTDAGIEYRSIPVSRNGLNIFGDLSTYWALKKLISELHPEKIFTYQAKTIVYGTLAARRIDKHIEVYPLVAGLGSIFRGNGLKNILIKTILSLQYRVAFSFANKVIFQNEDDLSELVRSHLLPRNKCYIIHGSGVNTNKFVKTELPKEDAILFIGRLIGDKGIREYLELAKRIKKSRKEVKCMLVGPFDSNPSAISQQELQPYIDNNIIEYYGEQTDVRPYLTTCTVYVLPSYHEGTPKTVLEAMSMGRPIVTTDAPGCRETVSDGVNGYLVPIKNVDALETAVNKILNNRELATHFSENSRHIAEQKYDVKIVNTAISEIMNL